MRLKLDFYMIDCVLILHSPKSYSNSFNTFVYLQLLKIALSLRVLFYFKISGLFR